MIWITNNQVAWQLDNRIGGRLLQGIYESPPGWQTIMANLTQASDWYRGTNGEMRKREGRSGRKIGAS